LRNGSRERTEAALPDEFVPDAIHLVRIDVDRQFLKISLDEKILFSVGSIDPSPKKIALLANGIEVAFSGFALTGGFEDLFETNDDLGWHTLDDKGRCYVENKLLSVSSKTGEETKALKMQAVREYDFAVNIRLDESRDEFAWGFVFIDHSQKEYGRISIRPDGAGCDVKVGRATRNLPFPQEFSAQNFHQFGVLIKDGRLHVRMEDAMQGEFTAPRRETRFGIFCKNATVNIDMARLTVL
jgi:hypothetical protein